MLLPPVVVDPTTLEAPAVPVLPLAPPLPATTRVVNDDEQPTNTVSNNAEETARLVFISFTFLCGFWWVELARL